MVREKGKEEVMNGPRYSMILQRGRLGEQVPKEHTTGRKNDSERGLGEKDLSPISPVLKFCFR